jgi:MFS transporter, OFA family, oxalate/formate antiporter
MKRSWTVVMTGALINLLMGVSYSWSVFAAGLVDQLSWSQAEAVLPFTVYLFVYATAVFLAGSAQDRYGPRPVVMAGGLLTSLGFIAGGIFLSPLYLTLCFGFLYGVGNACTFSTITPTAVKWFPPAKRGLVTGISVSTVGLSPLLMAPLAHGLLVRFGAAASFVYMGIFLGFCVVSLGWLMQNPTEALPAKAEKGLVNLAALKDNMDSGIVFLWLMFCFTTGAGLMVIANLVKIAAVQVGVAWGYLLLPVFAGFNFMGRLMAGESTDRFGVYRTVNAFFLALTVSMAFFIFLRTPPVLLVAVGLLGLAYGSLFSLFPALAIEQYGLSYFGTLYGLIFTAMGVGGFIGPLVAGRVYDSSGTFTLAYILGMMASLAAIVIYRRFLHHKPK